MIKYLTASKLDKKYLAVRPYQATPISADFLRLVVKKPWGNEYLMYSNDQTEVWSLFIGRNRATSMHCHPNKKTAILVLDGIAQFSSLNESLELTSLDGVIIEPGVFHSTQAISKNGVRVLEFETPPMKHDLVRLEDKYGRANQGYEGAENMVPNGWLIRFSDVDVNKPKTHRQIQLCVRTIPGKEDIKKLNLGDNSLAVILSGSILSKNGDFLYGTVDALRVEELKGNGDYIYNNVSVLTLSRR